MNLAITINLVAIVVIVGGWTAAVWAFYKNLSDPRVRAGNGRRLEVVQARTPASSPSPS